MGFLEKSSQATTCPNQTEEVQLLKLTKPKAEVKANGEVQLLKLMPGNLTVPVTRKTGEPEAEAKRVPKKEVVEAMMLLHRPNRVLARLPPSPFPFCSRSTPS